MRESLGVSLPSRPLLLKLGLLSLPWALSVSYTHLTLPTNREV